MQDDEDPFDESLSDTIARATAGDVLAARDALDLCAWLLSPDNKHPQTGEPLPVPMVVREYLSAALASMVAGTKPDRALNLKKPSVKVWSFADKLKCAYMVAQLVAQDATVEEAAASAAEALAELQKRAASDPERKPAPLRGRRVSAETFKSLYFEMKDELKRRGL